MKQTDLSKERMTTTGEINFLHFLYRRTLNHLDLLAPLLLLRACGIPPPTAETLKSLGDTTDYLHCRAREEVNFRVILLTLKYEKDLENKKKWVEIHAQHMAERSEQGQDLEDVALITGKDAFAKRLQEVEDKWQKLSKCRFLICFDQVDKEFLERKERRKREDQEDGITN